jgi:hypothetical protein
MPTCANCGQENPDVARFCLACGAPLGEPADRGEERKVVTVVVADLVGFMQRRLRSERPLSRARASASTSAAAAALRWSGARRNSHSFADMAHNGSLPDEAFARLRAAERLVGSRRRAEGDGELQRALGFFRSVDPTAYVREGEVLLARTA